jgi:uncharacterized protein
MITPMGQGGSPAGEADPRPPRTATIVVASGDGSGAITACVNAVSDIAVLRTDAAVAATGAADAASEAVVLDVGRIDVDDALILYLFGAPGQQRARLVCDSAIGAIVLADTGRLADYVATVEYVNLQGLPFVVALYRPADGPGGGGPASTREADLAAARAALRLPDPYRCWPTTAATTGRSAWS